MTVSRPHSGRARTETSGRRWRDNPRCERGTPSESFSQIGEGHGHSGEPSLRRFCFPATSPRAMIASYSMHLSHAADRVVLFGHARRLLEWLLLDYAANCEGVGGVPRDYIAHQFSRWARHWTQAHPDLRSPREAENLLRDAIEEVRARSLPKLTDEYGVQRAGLHCDAFQCALDVHAFLDVDRPYGDWIVRVLRAAPCGLRSGTPDSVARFIPDDPAAEELVLTAGTATLRDLSPLASFERLRTLTVRSRGQLEDLQPLVHLVRLEQLDIEAPQVVDLRPIAALSGLRRLSLGGTKANDLSPLAELQALEELEIRDCANIRDLGPLARLPSLRALTLSQCGVCDLSPLSAMPALQSVDLSLHTSLDKLTALGELAQLRALHLRDMPGTSIAWISTVPHLAELTVSNCPNLKDLAALGSLTSLQTLDLSMTPVVDLSPLTSMRELRQLDLLCTDVRSIAPLGALTKMEELNLMMAPLENLVGLATCGRLRRLVVCPVSYRDLSSVSGLSELEVLWLDADDRLVDLEPLRPLRQLREITIDGGAASDLTPIRGMGRLRAAAFRRMPIQTIEPIAGLPCLRELDVSHCRLLESLLPLASSAALERILCDGCDALVGPRDLSDLRRSRSVAIEEFRLPT